MRKAVTAAIVFMMVAAVLPFTASAAAPKQSVEGSVALPQPNGTDNTCITGNHRRSRLFTNFLAPNGIVGFEFEVDPKTYGKKFKLEPTGGSGTVDLDIAFYLNMGSTDDPGGAPSNVPFEKRAEGGESGKVPPGHTIGLVCMFSGFGADFTYTAG